MGETMSLKLQRRMALEEGEGRFYVRLTPEGGAAMRPRLAMQRSDYP